MTIYKRNTSFFLVIFTILSAAETDPYQLPVFNISRTLGSITIDGHLDDVGWQSTNVINNFLEVMPGENIPPIVRTEAFVTYDSKNFYVAMMILKIFAHKFPSVTAYITTITLDFISIPMVMLIEL